MAKIRGLAMPEGCEIREFSWDYRTEGLRLFKEMISRGYRPAGVHTNTLKPGKASFFRHDGSCFVAWIKPLAKLDAHAHRTEKRKDGSEREFALMSGGGAGFKIGGKMRRCVDCGEVA